MSNDTPSTPGRDINALTPAEFAAYMAMADACDATFDGLDDPHWFACTAAIVSAHMARLSEADRAALCDGLSNLHAFAVRRACGIRAELAV